MLYDMPLNMQPQLQGLRYCLSTHTETIATRYMYMYMYMCIYRCMGNFVCRLHWSSTLFNYKFATHMYVISAPVLHITAYEIFQHHHSLPCISTYLHLLHFRIWIWHLHWWHQHIAKCRKFILHWMKSVTAQLSWRRTWVGLLQYYTYVHLHV